VTNFVDLTVDDILGNMIHDVGVESFVEALVYYNMSIDAKKLLYHDPTNSTRLSVVLRLMNLKAVNGWINKSFI